MNTWVKIEELNKKVDDFHLGPIDLSIKFGTITSLVGKNGSGKSTLLKLMMNLIKSDKGNITLFNQSIKGKNKNWKQNVSYLPQKVVGINTLSGNYLRDLQATIYPNFNEKSFEQIVHLFEIPLNKKYHKLSQGLQKKLDIALTIASNTPLMILDEPTAFLDIPSKKLFGDLIVDWMDNNEERTIIMTSHQVEDIRKLSDFLWIIDNGKMIGYFDKSELMQSYKYYWFFGELPKEKIPGEIFRSKGQLATNQPEATEMYFHNHEIDWHNHEVMDLEEVITLLLTEKNA